jgi:CRISPR-associated protein Cas2
MSKRTLYIAAYDVSEPARLRAALHVLKGYSSGGQKSVFECFLTDSEKACLLTEIRSVIDLTEDRFMLVRLDPRMKVRVLGIAVEPVDPEFFYVG